MKRVNKKLTIVYQAGLAGMKPAADRVAMEEVSGNDRIPMDQ